MANNIAQIIQVTSEALQAKVRQLLPSQQGFGVDLQASNVIMPVIDLTATAEGSTLPTELQNAIAFGSVTAVAATTGTTTLANTAGFWRIWGDSSIVDNVAGNNVAFTMTDGLSTKTIWKNINYGTNGVSQSINQQHDFYVWLDSGESISVVCSGTYSQFNGCYRQIADTNGNLVNPSGYNPQ